MPMNQNAIQNYANQVLDRIKNDYGFVSDKQLASHLDLSAQNIANWRRRNSIDFKLIIDKCSDMDLNFLFKGSTNSLHTVISSKKCNFENFIPWLVHHSDGEKYKQELPLSWDDCFRLPGTPIPNAFVYKAQQSSKSYELSVDDLLVVVETHPLSIEVSNNYLIVHKDVGPKLYQTRLFKHERLLIKDLYSHSESMLDVNKIIKVFKIIYHVKKFSTKIASLDIDHQLPNFDDISNLFVEFQRRSQDLHNEFKDKFITSSSKV